MAALVPTVPAIMGFVGAVFFSSACILIPVVLDILTVWPIGKRTLFRKLFSYVIIGIWAVIVVFGVMHSIIELVSNALLNRRRIGVVTVTGIHVLFEFGTMAACVVFLHFPGSKFSLENLRRASYCGTQIQIDWYF